MKAFVIKNKEGEYWYGYDLLVNKNLFTSKISNAVLNNPTKQNCLDAIKEYGLKDCEVVPVTIVEGDLERENKQLKEQLTIREKALELACETIKQYIKIVFNKDYEFNYEHFIDRAKGEIKNERRKS